MQLFYPIGTSQWQHNELRYSLRSVQRYAPEVNDVVIVGNLPEWCQGVQHIPHVRTSGSMNADQHRKLKLALEAGILEPEFVWMADDYYLLDAARWHERFHVTGHRNRHEYFQAAFNRSCSILRTKGIDPVCDYEQHMPMVLDREKARECMALMGSNLTVSFKTLYGNLFPEASEEAFDVKLRGGGTPREWWCFSTDDGIVRTEEFARWMAGRYPEKSRWEVEGA